MVLVLYMVLPATETEALPLRGVAWVQACGGVCAAALAEQG